MGPGVTRPGRSLGEKRGPTGVKAREESAQRGSRAAENRNNGPLGCERQARAPVGPVSAPRGPGSLAYCADVPSGIPFRLALSIS